MKRIFLCLIMILGVSVIQGMDLSGDVRNAELSGSWGRVHCSITEMPTIHGFGREVNVDTFEPSQPCKKEDIEALLADGEMQMSTINVSRKGLPGHVATALLAAGFALTDGGFEWLG